MVQLHTRLNMLAAKDSKPVTSGEQETTTTEREKSSTTSMPQPSGLGELATTATAPAGRGQGNGAVGSGWFCFWSRQVGNVPRRGQPKVIAYTGYETNEVCPGDLGGT